MSKGKTVLKFSIAALLLGGSSTVAVLYFPYVALVIKFGIVISTAPLAIFAISVVSALASVITLAAFTISAIRSKGKSNKVSSEPRSKNEEKGQSLVQEKDAPTSTPPLLSQESEKSVIPIPQQPPAVEETETPQPENVMVKGADQQAKQTEESLPPYPEPTSPLNSMDQLKSFPELPSIVVDAHNNLGDGSNSIKNYQEHMSLPIYLPQQSQTLHNAKLALGLSYALNERRQQPNQASTIDIDVSWGSDFEDSIIANNSLPSVSITQELEERSGGVRFFSELNNVHDIFEYRRRVSLMRNCSSSCHTSMFSSIQESESLQASLGSDNPSVQSFQPEKELLYDVNKKIFDSVDYEVNYTRLSENAGEAPNYEREFPLTETNVNSGPEAMSYDVNDNRVPCEQTRENTLLDSLPSYPSTSSPLNSLDQALTSLPMFAKLRVALDQRKQQQPNSIDFHKADDVCSVTSTDVSITTSASCSNHASMTNSYTSWDTNWGDSITPSLAYQYKPSLTSIIEGVESGPEATSYNVNDNRTPYSSIQSPVLSSSANRSNSFSG